MPYEVLHFSGIQKKTRARRIAPAGAVVLWLADGLEQCLACHIGWLRHSHNLED